MFNQLFGKYLIESDIISEEQYEDILAAWRSEAEVTYTDAYNKIDPAKIYS